VRAPPDDPQIEQSQLTCPNCGTPGDGAQEYCLECGLRLPQPDALPARLGAVWQRRLRWYPGDWIWPALGLAVIAALGAAVAILSTASGEAAVQPTIVLTSPVLSASILTTPTVPIPTVPTPTPSVPEPTATPRTLHPQPAGAVLAWPAGRSGYTIVLGSDPKPDGLEAALAEAHNAQAVGLTRVGVLDSDRFSSLHPGYYVVFSGVYGSYSQANDQLDRARSAGYDIASARRVTS
jgi:hypothetical protein